MVPSANPEAIKAALERLIDNRPLGKRLAENARAVYESHASARVISSAITAISASCIEAKKKIIVRSVQWIGKREVIAVLVLLAVFIVIRLPGLSLPYHQDEAKIGEIVRSHMVGALSGHPPLTELLYLSAGGMVGSDHLRLIPLFFGVVSAMLLYAIVRRRAGIEAAAASLALYAICMYGVFASLMVDTDGAVLPTLFLAAVYAYDRFREAASRRSSYAWLAVLALALVIGFLTKLSFVLVLGALILDYLFEVRNRLTRALLIRASFATLACGGIGLVAVASAHLFIPSFDVSQTVIHALSYVRFEGRGYLQILIQAVKAIFYLSPLLLVPLVLISKDALIKNRVFVVYLALGAFFYFVLFDFSQGALDKYLMYTIVPLAAIVGTILSQALRGITARSLGAGALLGLGSAGILVGLNFLSPQVLPLYPKTEWISAIAAGNWNILFPFTGGDGPIGVYVSFLLLAAGFIISGIFVLGARFMPRTRHTFLVALMVTGIAFNAVFIEEFLFGRINGSAPDALRASLAFIAASDVKGVISHGEAGAYELRGIGKFTGRFYAVPGYEEGHRALFAGHTGQYLVVDVPLLNEQSFYRKFFNTCTPVFATSSGVIQAHVYDCAGSDPYAIK
jgi:4-amino-4-deoxy-L-arabinose transferase-like glycosyltransferase